ncbi:hypothetical protein [Patiriisocius hiemis]|uniref:Uncharacterized protein n=1 Tax=Patiriisocius hiemis TaxID=3075604 RepID=A0ABU2YD94_9FLAO|nr:hypothetical protein [Constantimarinum sp. W242]MDT0556164.1 hypothetical protein [Constantimarinum sp. W242]
MNKVDTPELLFYQKIGKLFYAVAASDKVVHKLEYDTLAKLVEGEWKKMDKIKDAFGTDAAYQIAIVFEWFDYEQMNAQDCYNDFEDYYKEQKNLFYGCRKDLIVRTARNIANAYRGSNKSELIMLTKLELLFKE